MHARRVRLSGDRRVDQRKELLFEFRRDHARALAAELDQAARGALIAPDPQRTTAVRHLRLALASLDETTSARLGAIA